MKVKEIPTFMLGREYLLRYFERTNNEIQDNVDITCVGGPWVLADHNGWVFAK